MVIDSGSFRDPSGCVFRRNGEVYRSIFKPGIEEYEAARDAGVYDKLIAAGCLIFHEEVDFGQWAPEGTVYCLRHPSLPMVSYPWEWPFSLLKDAALLHLEIMEILLPLGFWLRDASAFNVQYDGTRICFIDTLSIGRRIADSPWLAYGQFCSHFLAPLAMAAYGDVRTLSLWRSYMDGYPLDMTSQLLSLRRKLNPRLFMHLTLHARFQKSADKKENIGRGDSPKKVRVSDRGLVGLIRSLRKTVRKIHWKRSSRVWESYAEIRTYTDQDVVRKSEYVEKTVRTLRPKIVWDLGANTGEFSLLASSQGAFVVSVDGDPACTERLYQKISRNADHSILPLTMDLANPSPALGWNSSERMSLNDRGPANLAFALALVHHLVLAACIPLPLIAEWLARIADHALVEFVPTDDPMVKKLLMNRGEDHLPYGLEVFEASFEKFFNLEDQMSLGNERRLYLFKRK